VYKIYKYHHKSTTMSDPKVI